MSASTGFTAFLVRTLCHRTLSDMPQGFALGGAAESVGDVDVLCDGMRADGVRARYVVDPLSAQARLTYAHFS
jgi:hypothetical protein